MNRTLLSIAFSIMLTCVYGQEKTVTGNVISIEDRDALIGVNVFNQTDGTGAATDYEGNYTIQAAVGDTLVFSYIGFYDLKETVTAESDEIDVQMIVRTEMKEIVVTALSLEREKSKVGYSVEKITSQQVTQVQELNVANALSGKISGLQINSGPVPGASNRINLRGIRFLNLDNSPLIIIDGVQINTSNDAFEEQEFFGLGGQDFGNGLNEINPEDISTVSVLKGITGSSLYGSRGANGVIIITTKKGKERKGLGVALRTSLVLDNPYLYRNVQNQYGQGESGAWVGLTDNGDGTFNKPFVNFFQSGNSWGPKMEGQMVNYEDGTVRPFSPNPNNIRNPFENGIQQNTNLSFAGGNENIRFRAGVTYANVDRIVPNSYLRRYAFNTKTTAFIAENLNLEVVANYTKSENFNPLILGNSELSIGKNWLYNWNRSTSPEVLNNYRQGVGGSEYVDLGIRGFEYYKSINEDVTSDNIDRLISGVTLKYFITNDLVLTARAGIDLRSRNRYFESTKLQPGSFTGRFDTGQGSQRQTTYEGLLSYKKIVSEAFSFGVTAGLSEWSQQDEFLSFSTQTKGLTKENIFHVSAVNIDGIFDFANLGVSQQIYRKKIRSIFGLADFSFYNFVNLQITGRNDWSSTLPLDNNNYFYPSINGSIVLEDVLKLPGFVDQLIVKGSYAQVRTDEEPFIIAPTYAEAIRFGQYSALLAEQGVIPPTNLDPSQLDEYEIGLDLKFLDGIIGIEATFFNAKSTKQSITSPISTASGFGALRINTAAIRNRGIEVTLSAYPVRGDKFKWESFLTFSSNRNTVLAISDDVDRLTLTRLSPGTEYIWAELQAEVGHPYGRIYANDYDRAPDGRPIINTDGTWKQTEELVPLGNVQPDFFAGFRNSFSYKNFRLFFLVDGTFGNEIYAGTKDWAERLGQSPVTLEGRDASTGGLTWTDAAGNARDDGAILEGVKEIFNAEGEVIGYEENDIIVPSKWRWSTQPHSANILDASFVKLRELSFGYTLPSRLLDKTLIKGVRFNLIARNLFYIYSALPDNYNPEAVISKRDVKQGIEFGALPGTRSFGFDLRLNF